MGVASSSLPTCAAPGRGRRGTGWRRVVLRTDEAERSAAQRYFVLVRWVLRCRRAGLNFAIVAMGAPSSTCRLVSCPAGDDESRAGVESRGARTKLCGARLNAASSRGGGFSVVIEPSCTASSRLKRQGVAATVASRRVAHERCRAERGSTLPCLSDHKCSVAGVPACTASAGGRWWRDPGMSRVNSPRTKLRGARLNATSSTWRQVLSRQGAAVFCVQPMEMRLGWRRSA